MNFRFSTASPVESLQQRVTAVLDSRGLDYSLDWSLSGMPFLTERGTLSEALREAIRAETGLSATPLRRRGTSTSVVTARICPQVIEFGPPNASIHKVDEQVELAVLEPLKNIYRRTIATLLRP